MKTYKIQLGWRYPFGVTVDAAGVNFSIWGQRATSAELLLYEQARSTSAVSGDPPQSHTPPHVLLLARLC